MSNNCFITKLPFITLVVSLVVLDAVNFVARAEAKHYNQPYGDIMQEENENSFDVENVARNRYGLKHKQQVRNEYQQTAGPDGRLEYSNEYEAPGVNSRRGEKESSAYKTIESSYYTRKNRHPYGWIASSNIVEEQQQDNVPNDAGQDAAENKCNIWVPMDAFDKYPEAEKKQENKIAGLVYIEICCKDYAPLRWRGKTLCRPICENCHNGRCVAPGVCECYDEYVSNDNGDCVFTCPLGCLNGRCYLDGSCECDPGFKLDASRKFCKPICSRGCGNSRLHNCTEPEVCGCINGYVLTDNGCQPVCQHDCGNGGICRQPDVCECNPGFDLKDGVCQADCYQKCNNGICFSRNRCICNPGFSYHERSTQCIPN